MGRQWSYVDKDQSRLGTVRRLAFIRAFPPIAGGNPNRRPGGTEGAESHQRIDYQACVVGVYTCDPQQYRQPQKHGYEH
jgi:hypothetical protein